MAIQTTSSYSSSLAPVKKLTTASSGSSTSGPRKRIDNTVYWSIVWRAITPRVGRVLPPLRRLSPE